MPRIEVINIKFNLDSNEVDAAVYAALRDIPRGKRSSVVKELLHAALCAGEAESLQVHEKTISMPKGCANSSPKGALGSQAGHPFPCAASHASIREMHSEQVEEEKDNASGAAAVEAVQIKGNTKELDEFRSLIY